VTGCRSRGLDRTQLEGVEGGEVAGAADEVGTGAEDAAHGHRGDERLSHPDEHVHGDHGGDQGDERHLHGAPGREEAGEHQRRRRHRRQGGGEGAAHEVAAGAGRHREVDHLYGEDEGRHQAGQRCRALVELPAGPAQAGGDTADRDRARSDSHCGGEEPVGHVHQDHPWDRPVDGVPYMRLHRNEKGITARWATSSPGLQEPTV
jgi:hypothetical protein